MSAVTSQSLSTALTVISANIEGRTAVKASILSEMCKRECCHCLCLQETHRSTNLPRPKIAGMSLVVECPHNKYGSAILIQNDLKMKKINERVQGTVEIITIVMSGIIIHSVYKPPNDLFELPALVYSNLPHIVIRDFTAIILRGATQAQITKEKRLQTTQPTSDGAVTADSSCCVNCVKPSRPIYSFWACWPWQPAGWLALLLTKVGDVETNPGQTTLNKKVWSCDICHKQIHVRKQISICCNRIEHWVHLRCAGIRQAQYTDTWTCHLHRESRLTPHTDITPPHRSRPWSKPPTHLHHSHHRNQNTDTCPTLFLSPQDW